MIVLASLDRRNRRMMLWLAALPIALMLLGLFAFKPFYRLWCNLTGTGYRPNNTSQVLGSVGTGRFVQVFFQAQVFDGLPLKFHADRQQDRVEVGRDGMATFYLENPTDQPIRIRPIHQVSPINAAKSFGMKVCFCFNDQDIEPYGKREFPVVYTFASDLDARIESTTLCYSLFRIGDGIAPSADMQRIEAEVKAHGAIVGSGAGAKP